MDIWITIRTFIACYLVLLGLGIMFGTNDSRVFLGALLAAIGMSFFCRMWIAMRTGR